MIRDTPKIRAILLRAMPGTLRDIAERIGLPVTDHMARRKELYPVIDAMMADRVCHKSRRGLDEKRIFAAGPHPGTAPAIEGPDDPNCVPVILVSMPGLPLSDPGRLVIYRMCHSRDSASSWLKSCRTKMPTFVWSGRMMTRKEVADVVRTGRDTRI